MKTIYYTLGLLSIFAFQSCEDENSSPEPDPITFMTIEVNENFIKDYGDSWVFATNEMGEVLDIIQLQSGTPTVELKTTTNFATLNFTIFAYYNATNHFSLETFKGFPRDETIVLGTSPVTPTPPAGNANISVTNYTEPFDAIHNVRFSTKKYGTNGLANPVVSGSNYSADIKLATASETVHIYGIRSGVPVYKTVTEVIPGESRTVDFLTFTPFENIIYLPFTGSAYTVGISDDKSEFELVASADPLSVSRLLYTGTVPGFSKYLTYIWSFDGFEYWKIGTPITSFMPPEYTISVANNTIQNFQSGITGSHDYKQAVFVSQAGNEGTSYTWSVNGDSTTPLSIDFDLPNELKSIYPTLTKDGLEYSASTFYRSSGTYTYNDMLAFRFKNVPKYELELFTLKGK